MENSTTETPDGPAIPCTALFGTLIEAGTDDDGQPRLIIHATEEAIRNMGSLPLYRKCEITFRWKDEPKTQGITGHIRCRECGHTHWMHGQCTPCEYLSDGGPCLHCGKTASDIVPNVRRHRHRTAGATNARERSDLHSA